MCHCYKIDRQNYNKQHVLMLYNIGKELHNFIPLTSLPVQPVIIMLLVDSYQITLQDLHGIEEFELANLY